ncbi:hypothetical protein [Clostridium sp. DJ247]|uniref:hypothetical protein n=1 Tax=Clostridium sp. DJ247 TaxID=2726188 RepID=UPI0016284854|nr:hypothetical protein [Clostridium sp. DJ247]MBC2578840.1 hypothetical protein [Clostridium sp. DJ247]
MGILLGIFIGTNETKNRKRQKFFSIFVITIFYIIGRYFAYSILHIESAYSIKPLGTFIWTLCQGLWIGIIYFILQSGIKGKSVVSQGLFFEIVIFGLNWLAYHFFIPVMYDVSLVDIFMRVGIDVLFITVGVCTCKKLFDKSC